MSCSIKNIFYNRHFLNCVVLTGFKVEFIFYDFTIKCIIRKLFNRLYFNVQKYSENLNFVVRYEMYFGHNFDNIFQKFGYGVVYILGYIIMFWGEGVYIIFL